jgi:hypothetical protein
MLTQNVLDRDPGNDLKQRVFSLNEDNDFSRVVELFDMQTKTLPDFEML